MKAAWIAGLAVAACVAILLADFAVASRRAPRDDKIVKALQEQVKADASLAPKLEAEQKRVTAARRARKARDNAVAWALIAASSLFLICLSWGRPPGLRPAPWPARRVRQAPDSTTKERVRGDPRGPGGPPHNLSFVDDAVAQLGRGKEAAIPLLQAIQSHYRYLPDEALHRLCELTEITPAQVAGTSSFYGQFRRSPVGRHIVRVCHGTACHVSGARQVTDELRRYLAIPEGSDTDPARLFTIEEVACLGCCSLAPVLMVDNHTAGRLTPARACDALQPFEQKEPA